MANGTIRFTRVFVGLNDQIISDQVLTVWQRGDGRRLQVGGDDAGERQWPTLARGWNHRGIDPALRIFERSTSHDVALHDGRLFC